MNWAQNDSLGHTGSSLPLLLGLIQVLWQVDTILFSLLIQRGLCDSQGRVWRNHPSQLYAIEVTLPEPEVCIHVCSTL